MSSTSSLILLWARPPVHTSPAARAYLRLLDLSDGEELLRRCDAIWRHYGEVIKNRKRQILNLVLDAASRRSGSQIVIFGSGMDALSLEAASAVPDASVYEVDHDGMDEKRQLIARCAGGNAGSRIRCITAELGDTDAVMGSLRSSGWRQSRPSILVFEGISYWVSERSLSDLISGFRTPDLSNTLVLEYLVHRSRIADGRASIPDRIFAEVQNEIRAESGAGSPVTPRRRRPDSADIARYDAERIQGLLGHAATVTDRFTLREMELGRTGRNTHFGTDQSGWIEVCRASI